MTDEKILKMMRRGDPAGLERLMDRYIPYLSAVVWNLLKGSMTPEDGEEVVSDVFLAAWEHCGELSPETLKAWLGTVARNKAKSRLRKAGREVPLEEAALGAEDSPWEDAQKAEQRRLVRRAVDGLPPEDREIFLRYYYRSQTVGEISQQMHLNESTVKTRLRRGRMRLKETLIRWDAI